MISHSSPTAQYATTLDARTAPEHAASNYRLGGDVVDTEVTEGLNIASPLIIAGLLLFIIRW
jgi:hypothetical protein